MHNINHISIKQMRHKINKLLIRIHSIIQWINTGTLPKIYWRSPWTNFCFLKSQWVDPQEVNQPHSKVEMDPQEKSSNKLFGLPSQAETHFTVARHRQGSCIVILRASQLPLFRGREQGLHSDSHQITILQLLLIQERLVDCQSHINFWLQHHQPHRKHPLKHEKTVPRTKLWGKFCQGHWKWFDFVTQFLKFLTTLMLLS